MSSAAAEQAGEILQHLQVFDADCARALQALTSVGQGVQEQLEEYDVRQRALESTVQESFAMLGEQLKLLSVIAKDIGDMLAVLEEPAERVTQAVKAQVEALGDIESCVLEAATGGVTVLQEGFARLEGAAATVQTGFAEATDAVGEQVTDLIETVEERIRGAIDETSAAFEETVAGCVQSFVNDRVGPAIELLEQDLNARIDVGIDVIVGRVGGALQNASEDLFRGRTESGGQRDSLQDVLDTLDPAIKQLRPMTEAVQALASSVL